jgi:hypothetical protein
MSELDRVIRPSAQHVTETIESAQAKKEDAIGGE